jgi:hypothetical protein
MNDVVILMAIWAIILHLIIIWVILFDLYNILVKRIAQLEHKVYRSPIVYKQMKKEI